MDDLSKEIWKLLLPAEREAIPQPAKVRGRKVQVPHADHWPAAILLERAAYLRKLARHGDGQASETLKEYPQHATMLSFRARDGVAELHENFADLFYVLDGRATLVTGGTVVGAETIGPGEIRGASIEGGVRRELRAGAVAHVPAGVPHQMLVAGDKTFTSFVVKIEQNP
jgi:mannose-6-phosphate isomerase-like protein (cupin superfamily)